MKAISLFSGIGGFDLGLERAGIETILQVEIDPFCRRVLEKHWPNVRRIADVRDVTADDCAGADLIYGGFPCQPVSRASVFRKAQEDERWLWPEFGRLIRASRPRYALMENVTGLLDGGLDDVLGDLATYGYDAEWTCLPASEFGAPHERARVFIAAYASGEGLPRRVFEHGVSRTARTASAQFGNRNIACGGWWGAHTADLRLGDGLPLRVARRHVRALGNAVVPQVAEYVGRRLVAFDAAIGPTEDRRSPEGVDARSSAPDGGTQNPPSVARSSSTPHEAVGETGQEKP